MFGAEIEMLPERNGNRMTAEVVTSKTEELGWAPKFSVVNYIRDIVVNKAK